MGRIRKLSFMSADFHQRRRGRPPVAAADLFDKADADFIKYRIKEAYESLAEFYRSVFDTLCNDKEFKNSPRKPKDVETVDRAFDNAFSGRRPLPKLLWKALTHDLNIITTDLPSRTKPKQTTIPPDAPAAYLVSVPNNLPRRNASLIGRDIEIEKVLLALAKSSDHRLLGIAGIGGIGKSALVLEVAHRCYEFQGLSHSVPREEFVFDAFVWICATRRDYEATSANGYSPVSFTVDSVFQGILKVVAPDKTFESLTLPERHQMVLGILREKRVLLIVDSLETNAHESMADFLQTVPAPSKAIVTSRAGLPSSDYLTLMPLALPEAIRMVEAQCGFEGLHGRRTLPDELTKKLAIMSNGIPGIILWVLDQMDGADLHPAEVIERLAGFGQSRFLHSLLGASYASISENSRRLLSAMVLPGMPIGAYILGDWLNIDPHDLEHSLSELRRSGLVIEHYGRLEHSKGDVSLSILERRYRMLPLVRAYVSSRGIKLGLECRAAIGESLFRLILARADALDWPSLETIDLVDQHCNLLCWGVKYAFEQGQYELVGRMTRACGSALSIRGHNDIRLEMAKIGKESARKSGNQRDLAYAIIVNEGWVHYLRGNYRTCLVCLNNGLVAARMIRDKMLEGIAIRLAAQVAQEQNDLLTANGLILEAIRLFETVGGSYQLAFAYNSLGNLMRKMSNYTEAESNIRKALNLVSELINSDWLQSEFLKGLAHVLIDQDKLEEAEGFITQAETKFLQLRNFVGLAACRVHRLRIAKLRGNLKDALVYANKAEKHFLKHLDKKEVGAGLLYVREEKDRLRAKLAQALAI